MGGKASRDKGARGERELFCLLSDRLGFIVQRNLSQSRDSGGDSLSVPGFLIECKRVESDFQPGWMAQAEASVRPGNDVPVVFYRRSRQLWRAAFRAADLLHDPAYRGVVHLDLDDAATFMREWCTSTASAIPERQDRGDDSHARAKLVDLAVR